jgi:hypothetical protein
MATCQLSILPIPMLRIFDFSLTYCLLVDWEAFYVFRDSGLDEIFALLAVDVFFLHFFWDVLNFLAILFQVLLFVFWAINSLKLGNLFHRILRLNIILNELDENIKQTKTAIEQIVSIVNFVCHKR